MKLKKSDLKYIEGNLSSLFLLGFLAGFIDKLWVSYCAVALGIVLIIFLGWMLRKMAE